MMLAHVVSIQSSALKDELATSSCDTYRVSQFITMMCTYQPCSTNAENETALKAKMEFIALFFFNSTFLLFLSIV